jgi:hypothetical protein
MVKDIFKSKEDIKNIQDFINNILKVANRLEFFVNNKQTYLQNISVATRRYVDNELNNILKEIGIDEINRGELSLKLAPLKKAGYTNFYKIYKTPAASSLARVNGVSLENAYKIKKFVYDDAERIRKSIVPKLSLDNKTKEADTLVKVLFQYIESAKLLDALYTSSDEKKELSF